jgi:hypothetical protein
MDKHAAFRVAQPKESNALICTASEAPLPIDEASGLSSTLIAVVVRACDSFDRL